VNKVFITGITGQDGSYLAELMLDMGNEVHGLVRRSSNFNTQRIDHLSLHRNQGLLNLHHGDMTDIGRLVSLLQQIRPTHIFNLAAQSHVRVSFDLPVYTGETTGLATTALLEAARISCPEAFVYQASSSEMFGASPPPQSESTPFYPRSPYGAAKVYAYWMARNYREAYGMRVTNGILFNHESPRRGKTFVTRKITRAAALIKLGQQSELRLGNLEAIRDWGYAPEFVEAMWLMSEIHPGDYVVSTGSRYSVRDFLDASFSSLDLDYRNHVVVDERFFRPTEVDALIGDSSLIQEMTGWKPDVHSGQLAELMTQADFQIESKLLDIDRPSFRLA
jgi:GDPmannose 4,6-dehydratase